MSYRPEENVLPAFPHFPADASDGACPTGALRWEDGHPTPEVDSALCIGCGICASRCAVGAISLAADGSASIGATVSSHFERTRTPLNVEESRQERERFTYAERIGMFRAITDAHVEIAAEKISSVLSTLPPRSPTLLARNLLRALGLRAVSRRLGDVNVRVDLMYEALDGILGCTEVEFAPAVLLDTPRNVLDDVAVAVGRHQVPRERVGGLILALALPNERSEFWQVLQDIKRVLGIHVGVATIPALYMLVWNARLSALARGAFPLDVAEGTRSIRPTIEGLLGERANVSFGLRGVLESTK